jgi:signal transduction histidine kinase
VVGVPRAALGREMLQTGRLLELPVEVAIEVRLALLLAFTGARGVTLWTLRSGGELGLVSRAGEFDPDSLITRDAARRLLEHGTRQSETPRSTYGIRIERLRPPPAALVAEGLEPVTECAHLLFAATAPVLSALLDREALLAREHSAHESVVGSVERRLARLRFDLHDGPQQDVHLLAQDLRLFREQLRPMIAADSNADRVLGRLDDLEAQLVALDGDLRRLSTSVQSPFLTPGSLPEALRQLSEAFAARTGVEPEVQVTGSLAKLTDSQHITLLALIREALSNIRKHSEARQVTITIASSNKGIRAEITDDGSGFDPETTLVRAARAGRLGLVGMHERVRMLGGRTQINSRPGGPTVISATLPPWPAERDE